MSTLMPSEAPSEVAAWVQAALESYPDLPAWVCRALALAKPEPTLDEQAHPANLEVFEQDLETGTQLAWNYAPEVENLLRQVDLDTWMCTDTQVGLRATIFQGRAVALSFQPARKSDMRVVWFSKNDALQVRAAIREMAQQMEEEPSFEVASDDPSRAWAGVKRSLLRPPVPEPLLVEMVHPKTGETAQVDISQMPSVESQYDPLPPKKSRHPLIRLMTSLTPEEYQKVESWTFDGCTPGEMFVEFARLSGPVRAGQAYYGDDSAS